MKTCTNARFTLVRFDTAVCIATLWWPLLQLSWYIATQHTHNGYIVQIRNANMIPRHPKVGFACLVGLEVAYL